ncbi:MAG: N-acetylmuramoyl-L-alanine amidase [Candidatus Promineifilaceae bacterium]
MSGKDLIKSLFLLAFLLLGVIYSYQNSTAFGGLTGVKICLDPGHGGSDPGAVNIDYELEESDINLDVSYGLMRLLEGEAADVVMTRYIDEPKTNSDRYTYCNEQQATILISVHTNSVTDSAWDGSMALYGPRESPDLAQSIYDVMFPFLRETAPVGETEFIGYGVDRFASGVLFKSDMPAAMMEPVFMSHPAEAEQLVTPIFSGDTFTDACASFSCRRGQIAEAIYWGTLSYFNGQSGGAMHVAAIDMSYEPRRSYYFLDTIVSIQDVSGLPVPSAEVVVQITYPDGSKIVDTAVTGDDGITTLRIRTRSTGFYRAEILNVSKTNWSYDANIEIDAQLTIS